MNSLAELDKHSVPKDDEGKEASKDQTNSKTSEGESATADFKKPRRPYKKRVKDIRHVFPVEPKVIQMCEKKAGVMDHSYRDFSMVPPTAEYTGFPKDIKDMDFNTKIHHLLANADEKVVSWLPHGRAFKVHVPALFEQHYCKKYFGHSRYSSFLRQLTDQLYKHITQGPDRNSFYHEYMLRGMPHLTKYMPMFRVVRRVNPSPDTEPNFYAISAVYPVPAVNGANVMNQLGSPTEQPRTSGLLSPNLSASLSLLRGSQSLMSVADIGSLPLLPQSLNFGLPLPSQQQNLLQSALQGVSPVAALLSAHMNPIDHSVPQSSTSSIFTTGKLAFRNHQENP